MSTANAPVEADPYKSPAETSVDSAAHDVHFDSAAASKDLGKRTLRGGAVTLSAQAAKFALKLGSTAILARMLTPADFGLVAMVTVVIGFVEMFKDGGLSMATVQKEKITHIEISNLFWINVGLSIVMMLVVAALAPFLAWFYGDPRLTLVTVALSIAMLSSGLALQHQALLRRSMQFGRLATIDVSSVAVGIVVAVAMGYAGYGYWALVGMTLATSISACVVSFLANPWVPGKPNALGEVWDLVKVGGFLTTSSVVNYLGRTADTFLIGWMYGAGPLGIYNRSMNLLFTPWYQLMAPIHSVVEPALCRARENEAEFKTIYQKYVSFSALVSFPVAVFLALNASNIIWVVLGPEWMTASPIFLALLPASIAASLRAVAGWLFTPLGRAYLHLPWATISSFVLIVFILVGGAWWGPVGVAAGVSAAYTILLVWGIEFAIKGTFIRRSDVWVCIIPSAVSSIVGLACCWGLAESNPLLVSTALWIVTSLISIGWQAIWGVPSVMQDVRILLKKAPTSEE